MKRKNIFRLLLITVALSLLICLSSCYEPVSVPEESSQKTFNDYDYSESEDHELTITRYNGVEDIITIPATLNGKKVVSIGWNAFSDGFVESVVIPEGITTLEAFAFSGCKFLKSVTLPNGLATIKIGAFEKCTALIEITIPKTVSSIGVDAFAGCTSLKRLTVSTENGLYSSIDNVLFSKNLNTLICYPSGIESTKYVIPDGTKTIESRAFENVTSLAEISFPETLTLICDYAFSGCTSLKDAKLPKSLLVIEGGVFKGCTSLKSVYVTSGIVQIGEAAFHSTSVESIWVSEDNKYFTADSNGVLFNKDKTILCEFPIGCPLKNYNVPKTVKEISPKAFESAPLESIKIYNIETKLSADSFYKSEIKRVVCPESLLNTLNTIFGKNVEFSTDLSDNA